MAKKPTYEELKQRVKELEQEAIEHNQVEQKLEEIQELDRKILYGSPVAFVLHDRDLRIVRLSRAYKDVTAYNPDEVLGKSVKDFMPESRSKALVVEGLEKVRDEGVQIGPRDILAPTKEEKYLSETILPIFDTTGKVSYVLSVLEDITDRKCAEEALQKASRFREKIVSESPVGISIYDTASGQCVAANDSIVELVGASKERVLAQSFYDIESWKKSGLLETAKSALQENSKKHRTVELTTTFGKDIALDCHFAPFSVEEKKYLLLTATDITERMKAERALRESQKDLNRMFSFADYMVCIADLKKGYFTKISPAFTRHLGWSEKEMLSKPILDFVHPDDVKKTADIIKEQMEKGNDVIQFENRYKTIKGDFKWFEWATKPVPEEGITYAAAYDVTERKEAEEALRESEARFRTIFEQAAVGVAQTVSKKGHLVHINSRFADILGYSVEEMEQLKFQKITHPDDLQEDMDNMKRLLGGEIREFSMEKRYYHKNGSIVWGNLTVSPMWKIGEEPNYHIAVLEDITERKQAEKALEEKKAELRLKAKSLEEVNTALRVLIKAREKDKTDVEEKVLSNVKNLVLPYIEKIEKTSLDSNQKSCIDILKFNLEEIVSPFGRKLSTRFLSLTPTEIRVANLVQEGKTTKEIAEFMNLSPKTIEFHRDKLREKLGIKKSKTNLRTYLLSL
jgi:PAS domain S-box-containing protein